MPLELHLELSRDRYCSTGRVVIPGHCAFVEDYGTNPLLIVGVSCNQDDDGFKVFTFNADLLEENGGHSHVATADTNLIYTAAEDETYRHPYLDESRSESVIVARSVGGLAAFYALRLN